MMAPNTKFRPIRAAAMAAMTLLAIAAGITASAPASAQPSQTTSSAATAAGSLQTIQNDTFWKDTDGNPIYSQGGGVFLFGSTYYWYGVRYTGASEYYSNPTAANSDTVFQAVAVYTSTDLVHWTFGGDVATASTPVSIPTSQDVTDTWFSSMKTLADTSWFGRLGVTYNETTHKYTILSQFGSKYGSGSTAGGEMFLQSDSPTGPFHYANIQTSFPGMGSQSTGDQTVFTDDDGSDYLIFSNPGGRATTYVAKISDTDSLSVGQATAIGYVPAGREGNAMFKRNGHYYVASSDLHGWNSSTTHFIKSTGSSITGPYTADAVLAGSDRDYSHNTQSGFFINVHNTIIYAGDRWSDFAYNGLGYNDWEPLGFDADGTPRFNSFSQWNVNAANGTWSVGAGNNYVLNPDFAADRVSVSTLTGWTTVADTGTSNTAFVTNSLPGANGSRWSGKMRSASAFSGAVTQTITVPTGHYAFTLKSLVTGQLDHARVHITSATGEDYLVDLNTPSTTWVDKTLSNIALTGGSATIRIEAGGTGSSNSVCFDALSLVRTSA